LTNTPGSLADSTSAESRLLTNDLVASGKKIGKGIFLPVIVVNVFGMIKTSRLFG